MPIRKTSLRLRLVIGFLLVSVPAMLTSAYVAARLISSAFEANVEQWLGETSRFFTSSAVLPTETSQGIFKITTGDEKHLMAGAVQSVQVNDKPAYVLVGTWLDDSYLGSIKVVTSLDVRLFAETSAGLESVMLTHPDDTRTVPDAIRERLAKGEDT